MVEPVRLRGRLELGLAPRKEPVRLCLQPDPHGRVQEGECVVDACPRSDAVVIDVIGATRLKRHGGRFVLRVEKHPRRPMLVSDSSRGGDCVVPPVRRHGGVTMPIEIVGPLPVDRRPGECDGVVSPLQNVVARAGSDLPRHVVVDEREVGALLGSVRQEKREIDPELLLSPARGLSPSGANEGMGHTRFRRWVRARRLLWRSCR